jgi:hypothetical protein
MVDGFDLLNIFGIMITFMPACVRSYICDVIGYHQAGRTDFAGRLGCGPGQQGERSGGHGEVMRKTRSGAGQRSGLDR